MAQNPAAPMLKDHALAYAARGIPVFPCIPGGKAPLTRNGFHDATTDVSVVAGWWSTTPQANIATPTGAPGVDVLDVDVRPDGTGWSALNQAQRAGLLDGWLRAIATPSGGLHLHYPGTDQRNGSIRGQHLDFRGAGGYVLVPPSLGQTKTYSRRYTVARTRPGPGKPIDWGALTALLQPPVQVANAASRQLDTGRVDLLAAHVARQPEGNRDNALFWAACRAAETRDVDPEPLVAAGIRAGLTERQARQTVRSAYMRVTREATPSPTALYPPTLGIVR